MKNQSTTQTFPKTLEIRNTVGGMIWQIYHVKTLHEAERLSSNAQRNGFYCQTLTEYQAEQEETWPDWRVSEGGKNIISEEE